MKHIKLDLGDCRVLILYPVLLHSVPQWKHESDQKANMPYSAFCDLLYDCRCLPAAARACGGALPKATPEASHRWTSRTSRASSASTSRRSRLLRHTPRALSEAASALAGQAAERAAAAKRAVAVHVTLRPAVRETRHHSGYSTHRGACRSAPGDRFSVKGHTMNLS